MRVKALGVGGDSAFSSLLDLPPVDVDPPTNPVPVSSSHTVSVSSANRTIATTWPEVDETDGASDDLSGVSGYSWSFSQSSD